MKNQFWAVYQQVAFVLDRAIDISGSFNIITAFNPLGNILSSGENHERHQELLAYLQSENLESFDIIGASKDLTHQELSLGILCSTEEADQIALKFEQNAYYRVDNGVLYLSPAIIKETELKMGVFSGFIWSSDQ